MARTGKAVTRGGAFYALALVLGASLFVGCTVDDTLLDERLYRCRRDSDCGEGASCAYGGPVVGFDFCAPRPAHCDPRSCDGVCTGNGECLRGCDLPPDGDGTCPVDGTTCIASSLGSSHGLCYPVAPCKTNTECLDGELCLTTMLGVTATQLYCMPAPTENHCVDGYFASNGYCYPYCSESRECPPSFGCLALSFEGADGPICFPGVPGIPCVDDSNCFVGTCRPTPSGARMCTRACTDLESVPGRSCSALSANDFLSEYRTFTCERSLDACLPRYKFGVYCNAAFPCEDTLVCREFTPVGGTPFSFCTRDCTVDEDCASLTLPAYCDRVFPTEPLSCLPKANRGSQCQRAAACKSGRCTDGMCE